MSLGLYVIPTCFKKATIVLVPEKFIISHLNNYSHIEITSIVVPKFPPRLSLSYRTWVWTAICAPGS